MEPGAYARAAEDVARWLWGHETGALSQRAAEDLEDISAASTLISFTEVPRSHLGHGGRHVEFGAALALGKRVLLVGERECVFHHLPNVEVFSTWDQALTFLINRPVTFRAAIGECKRRRIP